MAPGSNIRYRRALDWTKSSDARSGCELKSLVARSTRPIESFLRLPRPAREAASQRRNSDSVITKTRNAGISPSGPVVSCRFRLRIIHVDVDRSLVVA
jgi:hypothetical protein